MSDGPHRTLPMRKHWRDLAERAAKAAHSPEEVREALPRALKRDLMEAQLESIRHILGGQDQETLFADERVEQLDGLRRSCRGSAVANIAIDCAIDALSQGLTGDAALQAALENACDERARSGFRSVEEHYQREANARSAKYVRDRMDAARQQCDFRAIASEIVSSGKPKRDSSQLPQHTGLDEGPKL